jgi:hypothetical protein
MKFTFKIGDKIKEAWPIYKMHFGNFVLLFIITIVSSIILSGRNIIIRILSYAVSVFLAYIWIRFTLSLVDKKEYNPFSKEALPTSSGFWNLLITMVLFGLCIMAGLILLVIPGLYILGRLIFAPYLSVEKNQGAISTIEKTWNMTKDHGWELFLKSLLIGLFAVAGFILLFVGGIVTCPISYIVFAMMYREFSKMKLQSPAEPVTVAAGKQ